MNKKIMSLLISLVLVFSLFFPSLAKQKEKNNMMLSTEMKSTKGEVDKTIETTTSKQGGRVIVIDLSRTSLENFDNIKFLRERLDNSGYIGLMNIRGDKGYDDRRNYATIGATGRVDIYTDAVIDFSKSTKNSRALYKASTGHTPAEINLNNINNIDLLNQTYGEFKSKMGYLGDTLKAHDKRIAVLGNMDHYDEFGEYKKNRDFCLSLMDSKGRIYRGNIDDINKKDLRFPYGISTDYKKLKEETNDYLKMADLLYVNLGDTYRLDMYKPNLNKRTYKKMKFAIYDKISDYIEYVFSQADSSDTIYVISSYPSALEYNNNKRLAPVVRFDMSDNTMGLLTSSTTRRKGIIANLDLGVDILSRFGLKNSEMVGRKIISVENEKRDEYLMKEYEKIVAISSIRIPIINIYVTLVSFFIILAAITLWQRNKISFKRRYKTLNIMKELIKLGLIMPLAFLTAPVLQAKTQPMVAISIVIMTILYYVVVSKIFKGDDIKQIGIYSLLMIFVITFDSLLATPLMESNIMSYDPMIGARYYGIGNEYEGVTIGSALLGFSILLQNKKLRKPIVTTILIIILFISAYPAMGANVGGAISGCIAFFAFILMVYDIKIDLKKIILIFFVTLLLVVGFAIADIMLGIGSHLGNFVEQITINGPMEVVTVFTRKIEMNVQLAQTTIWVNILLATIVVISFSVYKPNKNLAPIKKEYNIIYKGFLSMIAGCFVTLLVNDSGIISAATCSIYLIIPIMIMMINRKNIRSTIDEDLIC